MTLKNMHTHTYRDDAPLFLHIFPFRAYPLSLISLCIIHFYPKVFSIFILFRCHFAMAIFLRQHRMQSHFNFLFLLHFGRIFLFFLPFLLLLSLLVSLSLSAATVFDKCMNGVVHIVVILSFYLHQFYFISLSMSPLSLQICRSSTWALMYFGLLFRLLHTLRSRLFLCQSFFFRCFSPHFVCSEQFFFTFQNPFKS